MKNNSFVIVLLAILVVPDLFAQDPMVKTMKISEISSSSVRVLASADGSAITERGIAYSLIENADKPDRFLPFGNGHFGEFSCCLEGLQPSTTYYINAYCKSGGRIFFGEDLSVKTLPLTLPEVLTISVSDVTDHSARVQGSAMGKQILAYGLVFLPVDGNGKEVNILGGNGGFGSYSIEITDLTKETQYSVKFYATNVGGISYGKELIFTTQ